MHQLTRLDTYTVQARLSPALLTSLPFGIAIIAFFPEKFIELTLLLGLAISCGTPLLLTGLARDRGKKKEHELFDQRTKEPTTQMLRHRDNRINPYTKQRYHDTLYYLTNLPLPTKAEEYNDPDRADRIYDSCIRRLREATRNDRLVFNELINYGFRRNLWGMKPFGVATAAIGFLATFLAIFLRWNGITNTLVPIIATILNGLFLLWWLIWINPDWVRDAAFSYANRLLAACENFSK